MKKVNKPVIIISAFQEESFIGKTIDLIHRTGIDAEIIVVNDGSTDRTPEIALQKGCRLINFQSNQGKTAAVFAGMRQAFRMGPTCIVLLDADLFQVPRIGLKKMIDNAELSTKENRVRMCVGSYKEEGVKSGSHVYSGIRSFSVPAIKKLLKSKYISLPKGFGLEAFLNHFFPNTPLAGKNNQHVDIAEPVFEGRTAFGGEKQEHEQFEEIKRMLRIRDKLRALREKQRKKKPNLPRR